MVASPRPNLLILLAHDLGTALGCYGWPARTPRLDALAAAGTLVEDHLAAGVGASSSRASLFTGCLPHAHGLMGDVVQGWYLDADRTPPLARLLGAAGYATHLFGFCYEHPDPARAGYSRVHAPASYAAEDVVDAFRAWLAGRDRGVPYVACVSVLEARRTGLNPSTFRRAAHPAPRPEDVVVPGWLPDVEPVRQELAEFTAAVEHLDAQVGRALDALAEDGAEGETLVVLTTDCGPSFMHAKGTLYDAGLRLALLLRQPGVLPAGGRLAGLSSQIDVLPTLLDLLDLPIPAHVQGQSLASRVRGDERAPRDAIFAQSNYEGGGLRAMRALRTRAAKYVLKAKAASIFDGVPVELEESPMNFRRLRPLFDYYPALRVREELYDLQADPDELRNLAGDPAAASLVAEMRQRLADAVCAAGDPFLGVTLAEDRNPAAYERVRAASARRP